MKSMISFCAFFLFLASANIISQSWGDLITTEVQERLISGKSVFINSVGIHLVVDQHNNGANLVYRRLNSSGTETTSSFEFGAGEYPVIAGNESVLYCAFHNGSYIKVFKSSDGGINWGDGAIDDI